MNLVFMGTPEFAVPSLTMLAQNGYRVLAVFCQPDRPRGRSGKLQPCPVKEKALELGIPVHQPQKLREPTWIEMVQSLAPDLIVAAAYGQILPRSVLRAARLDCINVHASLLPRWRGASPIHHAIMSGDAETGISIMRMVRALDAGPVFAAAATRIGRDEGRIGLEARLAALGARLLVETLPRLSDIEPIEQDPRAVTYAPVIAKEMGYLDFSKQSAAEIARLVRAFEGWPGVSCGFRGQPIKLIRVRETEQCHQTQAGTLIELGKRGVAVACAEGSLLEILELQAAGKNPVPISAFVNGYRPAPGERLGSLADESAGVKS